MFPENSQGQSVSCSRGKPLSDAGAHLRFKVVLHLSAPRRPVGALVPKQKDDAGKSYSNIEVFRHETGGESPHINCYQLETSI